LCLLSSTMNLAPPFRVKSGLVIGVSNTMTRYQEIITGEGSARRAEEEFSPRRKPWVGTPRQPGPWRGLNRCPSGPKAEPVVARRPAAFCRPP
jgi:hypothetical protein